MDIQTLIRLSGEAYRTAKGNGPVWDRSYADALDERGLCIASALETTQAVISRNFSYGIPGPFLNPHGERAECGGRAITFKTHTA